MTEQALPLSRRIAAALFALFAAGFVVSAIAHLSGAEAGPADRASLVLGYAVSPVPFLVVGARACLGATLSTYRAWMAAFGLLVLGWMVASVATLLSIDADHSSTVVLHAMAAAAGALPVFVLRDLGRRRDRVA